MKYELREPEVKYITEKGRTSEVILAIKDYERLLQALEDLRDIRSADRRRSEPTISYATYRKKRIARIKASS
jgi:hypothetical protein